MCPFSFRECFHLLGPVEKPQATNPEQVAQTLQNSGIDPYLEFGPATDTPIRPEDPDLQKLREAQNLKWADDCLQHAQELVNAAQLEEAVKWCTSAVELDEFNKPALLMKAELLVKLKTNWKEAEESLRRAFQLDTGDRQVEEKLAKVMMLASEATRP